MVRLMGFVRFLPAGGQVTKQETIAPLGVSDSGHVFLTLTLELECFFVHTYRVSHLEVYKCKSSSVSFSSPPFPSRNLPHIISLAVQDTSEVQKRNLDQFSSTFCVYLRRPAFPNPLWLSQLSQPWMPLLGQSCLHHTVHTRFMAPVLCLTSFPVIRLSVLWHWGS